MDVTNSPAMKETTETRIISWHANYCINTLVVTNLIRDAMGTTSSVLRTPHFLPPSFLITTHCTQY